MKIQIPLKPDLNEESYIQIHVTDEELIISKLIINHSEMNREITLLHSEKNEKKDSYFGGYSRIIDRDKFIIYTKNTGELRVVDQETFDMDIRHKIK